MNIICLFCKNKICISLFFHSKYFEENFFICDYCFLGSRFIEENFIFCKECHDGINFIDKKLPQGSRFWCIECGLIYWQ
jgi:hypothetical protein